MITSPANPKVKYVRRLQSDRRFRNKEQAYVIEGSRWLSELLAAKRMPKLVLYTDAWRAAADQVALLRGLGAPAWSVSEAIMSIISDTQSAPGILAVIDMQPLALPRRPELLLIADAVTNPGNLGTMLRTAGAAGVDGVLMGPGCVDAYNPKVVRGGMGAHLRLPVHTLSWHEIEQQASHTATWLAAADGDVEYSAVDWRLPSALIIGSEASGASEQAKRLATGSVAISMHAATESLNAAIAAAVILFEASRQRRTQLRPGENSAPPRS